jgi:general secretion pathway protein M
MKKLQAWYESLQERERRLVLWGSIVVGILVLVGGVLLPLQSAVSQAVDRSEARNQDLEWMRLHLQEIRDGAALVRRDTNEAPVVLVDRVGHEAGIASTFRGTQPSGAAGVRIQLEGVAFDAMIEWLGTLDERYGYSVESITIDRTAKIGLVNANVTLTQPQP